MKFFFKILKYLFILVLVGTATLFCGVLYIYRSLEPELPSIETLKDIHLQVPLRIYSSDGKLIAEYGEKRRIPLNLNQIPEKLVKSFISAEDDRFFRHPGVDYHALIRAAFQLALTGERRQGGSTITMQVARNIFLSREKTFTRKLKEIFLALSIEKELSKDEILELYLNKIYLGNRAYGVGAAAQVYYGLNIEDLNLSQMAMLAGLPKAPSSNNPISNPSKAIERRNYVLERMYQLGYITKQELNEAIQAPISAQLHNPLLELEAPYVGEMARADVVHRFGDEAYTQGLNVYTSINSHFQIAANSALRDAIQDYDKRHGYRGIAGHIQFHKTDSPNIIHSYINQISHYPELERGLITEVGERYVKVVVDNGSTKSVSWAGLKWLSPYINVNKKGRAPLQASDVLKVGDLVYLKQETDKDKNVYWRLAQPSIVEGALIAMDPTDGAILALIGGYDFYKSNFNRVTQAHRQPGSGFKPFIYSAALEKGFTPATLVNDAPLVLRNADNNGDWRPENYSGKWFGLTRLRVGLYKSRNMISIRVLRAIGVEFALKYVSRFGFDPRKLPANLTLALGSGEVTPLQMARGYSVFSNGGYLVDPYFIDRIEKDETNIVFRNSPNRVCQHCGDEEEYVREDTQHRIKIKTQESNPTLNPVRQELAPRVISKENQFLMTSMLKDVIRVGTGVRAKSLGRSDLAGKTGTSNEQRDAWFNGFNPNLVAVAWVGFDSFQPLGNREVGGRVALPAWIDFMRIALDGVDEIGWSIPSGVVSKRIDPTTGKESNTSTEKSIFEFFEKNKISAKKLSVDTLNEASIRRQKKEINQLNQDLF